MTQEEKILLLQDLCGRLPYCVIVDYKENEYDSLTWKICTLHAPAYSQSGSLISTDNEGWIEYEEYKGCGMSTGSSPLHIEKNLPFLRPMSSMTEEEESEICQLMKDYNLLPGANKAGVFCGEIADWLNAHHFDYRDLISKGLALEAPKGMYNFN